MLLHAGLFSLIAFMRCGGLPTTWILKCRIVEGQLYLHSIFIEPDIFDWLICNYQCIDDVKARNMNTWYIFNRQNYIGKITIEKW